MDRRDIDRSNVGEGRYSNYAEIGLNASEFVFDFGQVWFDGTPAGVYVRVITSPDTAQRLYELLYESLNKYRNDFGEIRSEEQTEST